MNLLISLFFIQNVLATAYLGVKFFSQKDKILKNFGIALLLNCAAFAIWSWVVLTKPDNLEMFVTLGAGFFITALIFLLNTGAQNLKSELRQKILIGGVVVALILFYLRTFVYPSTPSFSEDGLFFFNLHPLMQMFYMFVILITSLPAINLAASKFKGIYATLISFGFLVEIIGGIVLITISDAQVLYLTGWIMGGAYFLLWAPPLLSKKHWSFSK